MHHITDAALTVITAALLGEDQPTAARRVAQYLISSGYRIAPDTNQPAAV